ncbi:unnamed protein product, partial [Vitis vinifera]
MKYNEIPHFSHPQHKLKFEYIELPFKCDGCKEAGIGSRYKCSICDYDLHTHCALPSPSITHPFYTKCSFQFLPRPPGDAARFCNACEKDINGFLYHCNSCGFDLHPCCARLPMEMLVESWHEIYYGRGNGRKLETRIPSIKSTLQAHHHKSKGKAKKCCEMAGLAMQFVVSAVLGDPTTLIAGVVGSLMSSVLSFFNLLYIISLILWPK